MNFFRVASDNTSLHRLHRFFLMAIGLLSVSCLPPGQQPAGDSTSDNAGDQLSAATPDGAHCHSGTFECADGATVTPCGTWYFDMNENQAVTGGGEITGGIPGAPVEITVSGVIDEGADSYELVLSSADGGSGQLTLTYPGPTLELAGSWSFTNAPEPAGIEVSGGAAGSSCTQLP